MVCETSVKTDMRISAIEGICWLLLWPFIGSAIEGVCWLLLWAFIGAGLYSLFRAAYMVGCWVFGE